MPFVAAALAVVFGAAGLVLKAVLSEEQNQDQELFATESTEEHGKQLY